MHSKKKNGYLFIYDVQHHQLQYVYYNHITKITRTMSNGYKKKKFQTQQPQISSPTRIQPIYPKKGMISAPPKTVRITAT